MMRQDGVIHQQSVGEGLGECRKIAKQQSLVIVRKWLLEGAGKCKVSELIHLENNERGEGSPIFCPACCLPTLHLFSTRWLRMPTVSAYACRTQ